ncbi:FtsX-like permease family protein [Draconibacterium sp. IB214405]|uniref:ABC transporter permease n=1 Tax=Draconibacterium sp. IB214405 TaxID=3097352 RepID=UPI002A13EBD0|nr:ABC transporter permease [Draconibacterium sp. IB214405]MDX8337738.1 FtsX-like permease family protein [Draconibacterium sp. IB214405]
MSFKNNLIVSLRHLKADKTNTFISVFGLILGLGIVAVILVYVLNEYGYNSSFANNDRIYRVLNYSKNDNNTWANTPFVIGETAKERFAEVTDYAHQYNIGNIDVKKNSEFIPEPDVICTESSFFSMFGVDILQGSLDDFDDTEGQILLSKKMAEKYFGTEDPLGRTLTLRYNGKESDMEVAAVFRDIPQNSSIKATLVTSIDYGMKHLADNITTNGDTPDEASFREAWQGVYFTNYLLLKNGTDIDALETKIKEAGKEYSTDNYPISLSLQALNDIYFGSEKIVDNNRKEQGNLSMLFVLLFIGILILLTASINYLNLASAKAMTQVKTFAVRKVCGAQRKTIIGQMIFESTLITLIALPFAVIAAWLALPYLSDMLGKDYAIEMSGQTATSFSILALITLATGILSGSIVSFRASRFGLVNVLKGNKVESGNKQYARKAMVVFQITIFIALISTMMLVQKQVRYAFNKDMGFAKEGLIRVPLGDHNLDLFKEEIAKNPNVLSASGTLWMPPSDNKMYMSIPKVSNRTESVKVNGLFVDYGFAETMGMKIIMGADFDKQKNNNGVLVNESAIETLGLTDVLGEKTAFGTVVGVVSDFNMFSIHEAITPMIIGLNPGMSQNIAIRLRTENLPETIKFLENTWKRTGGTSTFTFDFTNDILREMYESDIRFSKMIGLLAVIAICIASLGLFGLSLLMGKQRIKEIGVRKVNGAKVSEILSMLNKDFVIWVTIAFVLATPIAWFAMNKWLENFAYKTSLSWWIFALSGLMALGIALLTVSWQSWRAATRNPVEALRYE